MHYDYVPINLRPPLRWPDGNRVALIITLNLETWDLVKDTDRPYYAGGPAILPDVLPGDTPDSRITPGVSMVRELALSACLICLMKRELSRLAPSML
jgi:hypothetical protein